MTIKDARILIFNHFKDHQVIFDDELSKLLLVTENKRLDEKILESALEDLITTKFVKMVNLEQEGKKSKLKKAWVLTQPLNSYPQTVELSSSVVMEIASLLNEYCDVHRIDEKVDIFNIQEKDIIGLILVYKEALKIINDSLQSAKEQKSPTNS